MFGRLVFCVSLLLAASSPALAAPSVVMLGLRSIEGDDQVANDVTEQLRSAARAVETWNVSATAVSMAQMGLAHGCEEIDAACLNEIAKGLQADKIVYGTIRRTSARENYDFALSLFLFDAATGSIARQVDGTIERGQSTSDSLAGRARQLIARLSSTTTGGGIVIEANVVGAEVRVNGQLVGTIPDDGLHLQGLRPGRYSVEIHKDGYTQSVSTVSVVEGEDATIAAVLSRLVRLQPAVHSAPPTRWRRGHHLAWLGWSLLGLSVVSFAGTGVSLAVIDGVNTSPLYLRYRDAVASGNKMAEAANLPQDVQNDVCKAADSGNRYTLTPSKLADVQSECHTAASFQVLQWVFLGTAVVSGATGMVLLLTADRRHHEHEDDITAEPSSFSLHPSFGPGSARIDAALRF